MVTSLCVSVLYSAGVAVSILLSGTLPMRSTIESDNTGIEADEGQQIEVLCKGLQESEHLSLTASTGSRQSDLLFRTQHICSSDTLAREGTLPATELL